MLSFIPLEFRPHTSVLVAATDTARYWFIQSKVYPFFLWTSKILVLLSDQKREMLFLFFLHQTRFWFRLRIHQYLPSVGVLLFLSPSLFLSFSSTRSLCCLMRLNFLLVLPWFSHNTLEAVHILLPFCAFHWVPQELLGDKWLLKDQTWSVCLWSAFQDREERSGEKKQGFEKQASHWLRSERILLKDITFLCETFLLFPFSFLPVFGHKEWGEILVKKITIKSTRKNKDNLIYDCQEMLSLSLLSLHDIEILTEKTLHESSSFVRKEEEEEEGSNNNYNCNHENCPDRPSSKTRLVSEDHYFSVWRKK